ncbi:MAG TPA: alanine--glyoxylate aminotransferase family protein, partial [Thermoprotei archaeon]|nr:alanine--glyoxylate aminotransferase family protein [Thermoprotei archaeon]
MKIEEPILFLPGPVTLPSNVNKVISSPIIGHRTEEFHKVFTHVISMLKKIFMTKDGKIFLLTSSGTGGVEASIINCFSPGDRVIVPIYGAFSRRASNIMKRLGIKTVDLNLPTGEGPETEFIRQKIIEYSDVKGIFIV